MSYSDGLYIGWNNIKKHLIKGVFCINLVITRFVIVIFQVVKLI